MIELSEYVIKTLGKDKEFNLYRARNKGDKVLSPAAEYPAPETLKRLEHAWAAQTDGNYSPPGPYSTRFGGSGRGSRRAFGAYPKHG